ncbi:stage II sporulation protein P [Brevibacillus marinus]|uniref:stage II sporulation protein P n=1 Tax=Brevibacillus marinus TaxID=2496837 RepID=UPI000F8225B6|nr:stage II sporulation protein P [Brevibacillus marinus]
MTTLIQRQFMWLALATATLFVVTTLFALHGGRPVFQAASLQAATSQLSGMALLRLMSREIPYLGQTVQATVESTPSSLGGMLFELTAGIAPGDLRALLGRELPGFLPLTQAARAMSAGEQQPDHFRESPPPPAVAARETQAEPAPAQAENAERPADGASAPPPPQRQTKNVVFIYHTHNRESWLSVAKRIGNSVDHPTQNITLVGKRLAEKLRELGIGAVVNTDDIQQRLLDQGKSYALAYAESLKVVTAAKQNNRDLQYFFDLHRDDISREMSTVTIDGKTYARVSFVIGTANKEYAKNLSFAKQLHELIEQKYPGLSRGVNDKNVKEGHGEYNQSISPGSLLIEVGATRNTLEECYNTAEALAEVFADYYWQAEKVARPVEQQPAKR